MAELDEILKRYTDPAKGCVHGATFVAVDSKGKRMPQQDLPSGSRSRFPFSRL